MIGLIIYNEVLITQLNIELANKLLIFLIIVQHFGSLFVLVLLIVIILYQ